VLITALLTSNPVSFWEVGRKRPITAIIGTYFPKAYILEPPRLTTIGSDIRQTLPNTRATWV